MASTRPPAYPPERELAWTERQREVLALLVKGQTNAQIADYFGISLDGAKWHVREIMGKLGVDSREEAADYWRARNSTRARVRRAFGVFGALTRSGTTARIVLGSAAAAIAVGAFVAVLVFVRTGGDDGKSGNSAAGSSPTPFGDASNTATSQQAGPTIFYVSTSKETKSGNRTWPTWTVHAFDTVADADAASFSFGGVDAYPLTAALSGPGAVTATEHEVAYQRMDGSGRRVLATSTEDMHFSGMALSPDRKMAAVISGADGFHGELTFIDIATGHTVAAIERTDPKLAGFAGYFWQVGWLDGGSGVLVVGGAGKEGWLNSATVTVDGSVRVHEMDGYQLYARGVRHVVITHDFLSGLCTAGHELVVRDLDTEQVTNTVSDPTSVFLPMEWAPDGTALLVASWTPLTPTAGCAPTSDALSYSLLKADGGAPQRVNDVAALRRSWGPVHTVTVECPTQPGIPALASWPQTTLAGPIRFDCYGSPAGQQARVKFGEQDIGTVSAEAGMVLVLGVD